MGLGAGLLAHDLALEVREVAFFGLIVVERLEDLRVELSTLTNLHTVDFGIIIFKDVETQELEMTDISGAWSSILAFLGAIPIGLSHLELGIYDTAKDIQTSEYRFKDEPEGKSEDEEGDDNENDEDEGEGEGA